MRVLVDAHLIGSQETGNETYTINLLKSLAQISEIKCGAIILPGFKWPSGIANVEVITLPTSGNWNRILFYLPYLCRKWGADILHVTYIGPVYSPCPIVTAVHDVSFKRYPEFFSLRDRLLFATLFPLTLYNPKSKIITISDYSKQEIINYYKTLSDKIYVTPLAADHRFHNKINETLSHEVKLRYGIKHNFILAVGNLQPRKNLLRLIKAFAARHEEIGDVQLVIVGKAQWKSSAIYNTVQSLNLGHHIVFTGYVPDEDLVLLYQAARIFVYTSIHEGFGLPILEAMSCGTPVITSCTASMPEVAGEAAILVDPFSEEQIGQAIVKVLTDKALSEHLSRKGKIQASKFSWRTTAQKTFAVYKTILNNPDN